MVVHQILSIIIIIYAILTEYWKNQWIGRGQPLLLLLLLRSIRLKEIFIPVGIDRLIAYSSMNANMERQESEQN